MVCPIRVLQAIWARAVNRHADGILPVDPTSADKEPGCHRPPSPPPPLPRSVTAYDVWPTNPIGPGHIDRAATLPRVAARSTERAEGGYWEVRLAGWAWVRLRLRPWAGGGRRDCADLPGL